MDWSRNVAVGTDFEDHRVNMIMTIFVYSMNVELDILYFSCFFFVHVDRVTEIFSVSVTRPINDLSEFTILMNMII